jgi:hypothetical protein
VAYLVAQDGQSKYSEILRTKREAMLAAHDMKWWPGKITVTPLYGGKARRIQ